jgi:hypothetical protein
MMSDVTKGLIGVIRWDTQGLLGFARLKFSDINGKTEKRSIKFRKKFSACRCCAELLMQFIGLLVRPCSLRWSMS